MGNIFYVHAYVLLNNKYYHIAIAFSCNLRAQVRWGLPSMLHVWVSNVPNPHIFQKDRSFSGESAILASRMRRRHQIYSLLGRKTVIVNSISHDSGSVSLTFGSATFYFECFFIQSECNSTIAATGKHRLCIHTYMSLEFFYFLSIKKTSYMECGYSARYESCIKL